MSKHSNELERLGHKLLCRFGKDDALVIDVQRAIAAQKVIEAYSLAKLDSSISYRKFVQMTLQQECEPA